MAQKKISTNTLKPADLASWICIGVIALLPLTTFFTTWLGANFGHIDVFRIWKEIIIFGLSFFALYEVLTDEKLKKRVINDKIILLIFSYILVSLLLGTFALFKGYVNPVALIYGLLSNLRFVGFFVVIFVFAQKSKILEKTWQKALLIPASIVVTFGLLQRFVLPYDFLKHFGYSTKTIVVYHTIDQKLDYIRIQSLLRGPNPLGAYLILIITSLFVLIRKNMNKVLILMTIGALFAMFYTYSRSAWVGLVLSLSTAGLLTLKNKKTIDILLLTTSGTLLVAGVFVWTLRDNNFVQNTVFHTDENSKSNISSNEGRTNSQLEGVKEVIKQPLGKGVGTAGPASYRNDNKPRIAENYYTQIAQEVGIVGLIIFIYINTLIAIRLFKQKNDTLSLILFSSLIGITFVNLISHAWSDDVLSLIWWGLAAIALAHSNDILVKKEN